jgi:hypothetical protein
MRLGLLPSFRDVQFIENPLGLDAFFVYSRLIAFCWLFSEICLFASDYIASLADPYAKWHQTYTLGCLSY